MVSRISMYVRIFYNNWLLLGQKYRSLKTKIDYKSIILDQRHVRQEYSSSTFYINFYLVYST